MAELNTRPSHFGCPIPETECKETKHLNHPKQQQSSQRAFKPRCFNPVPAALDESKTKAAVKILLTADEGKQPTPYPVIEHIITHSPKHIQAWIDILQQVQNGIYIPWLIDLVSATHSSIYQVDATQQLHRESSVRSRQSHHSGMSGSTLAHSFTHHSLHMSSSLEPSIAETSDEPDSSVNNTPGIQQHYDPSPISNLPCYTPSHNTYQSPTPFASQDSCTATSNQISPHNDLDFMSNSFSDIDPLIPHDFDVMAMCHHQHPQNSLHVVPFSTTTPWDLIQPDVEDESRRLVANMHRRTMLLPPSKDDTPKFLAYKPPPAVPPKDKSGCPECEREYETKREFLLHFNTAHDQPVEYFCLHPQSGKKFDRICGYTNFSHAQFSKHHTERHSNCEFAQGEGGVPQCQQRSYKTHQRRVWGCSFCVRVFYDGDAWAQHHVEDHRGSSRRGTSTNYLLQSLLSQDVLEDPWQQEVHKLELSTESKWELKWPERQNDHHICSLITQLETGFWGDVNFHEDSWARLNIVSVAMELTMQHRLNIGPLIPENKRAPTSSPTSSRGTKLLRKKCSLPRVKSKANMRAGESAPATASRPPDLREDTAVTRRPTVLHRIHRGHKPQDGPAPQFAYREFYSPAP